jgi:hypothetical protein
VRLLSKACERAVRNLPEQTVFRLFFVNRDWNCWSEFADEANKRSLLTVIASDDCDAAAFELRSLAPLAGRGE